VAGGGTGAAGGDAGRRISALRMLKALKRAAPRLLRQHKVSDEGFARRNFRRWKKPLNLLELLWNCSEKVGARFNQTERPGAIVAKDYQFEALVSLHARALLISREILCLLYGGFPDGALSRWRSLHEIAVTAVFYIAAILCANWSTRLSSTERVKNAVGKLHVSTAGRSVSCSTSRNSAPSSRRVRSGSPADVVTVRFLI
jgi:hypothetical protein